MKPATIAAIAGTSFPSSGYIAKAIQMATGIHPIVGILNTPNSPQVTISLWVNMSPDVMEDYPVIYGNDSNRVFEKGWNLTTDLGGSFYNPGRTEAFEIGTDDGVFSADVWTHVFISADTNYSAGNKKAFIWCGGVDVLDPTKTIDSDAAFTMQNDGIIDALNDTTTDELSAGLRYSDVQVWLGQCIDPSIGGNISKFISGGKPVDPAIASAQFGAPDVLFSGDAIGFPVNQGSAAPYNISNVAQVFGNNGPGAITLTGAVVGDVVHAVWTLVTGPEIGTDFESVITVNDQLQQTSSNNYSGTTLEVYYGSATLTNAPTSPSD